ncbi:MAG: UvrD-helicase domain-containing protein [Muribaculaceae bacterium]|nr:UvrD-helicase domain-containing protein [Muribaculaceae bacterium]
MTDNTEYLDKLNSQQRAAVEYCEGPQLVIAGAGSGKTRVLTYKIVHLLNQGYEPWRILALTFTNKAAREMRDRIEQLTDPKVSSRLWMGTFHSIFARLLRRDAELIGYKSSYTIYDAADSRQLVKTIIKDMNLDEKMYKPATVASTISWAKNALISPEEYMAEKELMDSDAKAGRPYMANIYRAYRDRCRVAQAMDFDDLLFNTYRLLTEHPEVARHYQEYFRYILVDEYQDTNRAQHRIITLITGNENKLCVVGDDAQSIYSFRGANIRNILDLRQSYPALQTFKLERNYRSTQNIINAAGSLISKNTEQIPKNVFSENPKGTPIDVVRTYSDYEEAYQVAARLSQRKIITGDPFSEFAILYRTNAQSRILEEALRKRNIPYRIYGGLSFYQRKEVKDAVAYMRLAVNPDDDEALRRVINTPARGIGDTTMSKLTHAAVVHGRSLWSIICDPDSNLAELNKGTLRKIDAFATLIMEFMRMDAEGKDAYEVTRRIFDSTGIFAQFAHDRTPENIAKRENLSELLNGVKEFTESAVEQDQEADLSHFLSEISLATDQDSDTGTGDDRVTLMTVHAAKGLEFNNVFIVGVEEDLFPSAMARTSHSEIEEERRLLYVAMTRAGNFCMLSYAASRFRNGETAATRPSRFINDIDRRYLRLSTGEDFSDRTDTPRVRPTVRYSESMRSSALPINTLRPTAVPPRQAVQSATPSTPADGMTIHKTEEVEVGTRISHAKFGTGVITDIITTGDSDKMTVKFDNDIADSRTLLFKFAKFSIL